MAVTQPKKSTSDKKFIKPKEFPLNDAIDPEKIPKIKGPRRRSLSFCIRSYFQKN